MSNFETEKKYRINVEGVWYTPYIYDHVHRYNKSVIGRIEKDEKKAGNIVVVDRKCTIEGFALEDGKKLFCIENVVGWTVHDEYYIMYTDNDKFYIFFDDRQKVVGPFNHVEEVVDYNYILVTKYIKEKDKVRKVKVKGIYNEYGDIVIPVVYDKIIACDHETFVVNKNDKYGLFDIDGSCLIKPIYDELEVFLSNTELVLAYMHQKGKYGVFTVEGEEVLPVEYNKIKYIEEFNILAARQNGLWGFFDEEGDKILPLAFDSYAIISGTPFILLEMENNKEVYYNVQCNKFFQKNAVKLHKYSYKYFYGKWHRAKYER